MSATVRVAAVQLCAGTDVAANLETCLRLVADAAAQGAQLVVLPEFCNYPSWYRDHDHAVEVAAELDGPFVAALADAARRHHLYLKSNVTLHRGGGRITASNLLHGPDGALLGTADKLVLMGGERLHMSPADCLGAVLDTAVGRLGLYSCMDGVIWEPPRLLAVQGAQLLLNSLNSFALDEAALHIPVRAAENHAFVVAANKVGPLIPAEHIEAVAAQLGVPVSALQGAGESQVVDPTGRVLAIGPRAGEAVVVADIDPAQADDKTHPDGTDLFAARRPAVYGPLGRAGDGRSTTTGAAEVSVAVLAPTGADPQQRLERAVELLAQARTAGARLAVLPELFWSTVPGAAAPASTPPGSTAPKATPPGSAAPVAQPAPTGLFEQLAGALGPDLVVALSVRGDTGHEAVLLGADGPLLRQRPLHAVARHEPSQLAEELSLLDLPWGRLAVLAGGDDLFPESFRLATLAGAEVVACPTRLLAPWQAGLGLAERAAENRVNVVAATAASDAGTGLVAALSPDFTLWTQWSTPFAGRISSPEVVRTPAGSELLVACVRPACAANKEVSRNTDLVAGRPWELAAPLLV